VLKGTTAEKADALKHRTGTSLQIAVVNYESAWRMETEIMRWMPDLIICDEGHRIKNPQAAVSKCLHALAGWTPYRLLLTGTVIVNHPIDVFSQYKFVDPTVFGRSFFQFRSRYFDMTGYGGYTPVMKKSMESEFMERIHQVAFRVTKDQCLDLPEATDLIRRVDLEPFARRLSEQIANKSFEELHQEKPSATNVLTRLLRLSQLTGGFLPFEEKGEVKTQLVSTAKLDALSDLIDSVMEDGQKLVIIARFVPEIREIAAMLEQKGIRYAQVSGEVRDRDEQVAAFQHEADCRVFVGQIATAGLGITLTAASTMVFYSLDYSMANYDQTRARIHRMGQHHPCTYIHLIARGTVDEKVLRALRTKSNLAKQLIDDIHEGINPFSGDFRSSSALLPANRIEKSS